MRNSRAAAVFTYMCAEKGMCVMANAMRQYPSTFQTVARCGGGQHQHMDCTHFVSRVPFGPSVMGGMVRASVVAIARALNTKSKDNIGNATARTDTPYTNNESEVRAWLADNKLDAIADVLVATGADTMTDVLDITEDDKKDLVAEGMKSLKFKALLKAIKKSRGE